MKTSLKTVFVSIVLVCLQSGDPTSTAHAEPSAIDTFMPDSGESPATDFDALMNEYDGLPTIKHEQNEIENRLTVLKSQVDHLAVENKTLKKQLEYCQQGG